MRNVTITIDAKSEDYPPVRDLHDLLKALVPYYLDNVEVSHTWGSSDMTIKVKPRST